MPNQNINRVENEELKNNKELVRLLKKQDRQLLEVQRQLQETQARYADLYDFTPVGYLTLDKAGVVQEINLSGANMLREERQKILGQQFIQYLSPSSIKLVTNHLQLLNLHKSQNDTEIVINLATDKATFLNLDFVITPGKDTTCRVIMNDITEQHKVALALQTNRAKQEVLLGNIPAQVFYLDSKLCYIGISQAFADFIGKSAGEIAGKSVFDLFPDEIAEDFQQTFISVYQTGMTLYGFENSLPDTSGTLVQLSTVLAPYYDVHGKITGLVGVSIDISSIKSASNINSELLMQNRALTRSLFVAHEEERRYLARELHDELGQWFTAIQAEAQVICNVSKHAPNIHDSALAISKSASAVHEVIRGMLRHLRPSLLDELGLADSLRELQRQWCLGHPVIACDFNLDVMLDVLDEELNVTIYRLVQEALNNVAAHSKATRVVVSVQIENNNQHMPDMLVLSVTDDGSGFDPRQTPGGIGLLGMRERVIAAGGDFFIESEVGAGTTLLARLPIITLAESKQ